MTGFLEVMLIAFGYQLAVLPGEKVQFIIAGLSTRYHPLLVVGAAGSAFAGWTAVEILVGRTIADLLPGIAMGVLSGLVFVAFAYLLYRSAPGTGEEPTETDGGVVATGEGEGLDVTVFGHRVPNLLGGFLPIFAMMAVGEFGDKTQVVTFQLAAQYGSTQPAAIWAGEMLAILPVSLANAYFFDRFTHRFDLRRAHFFAAGLFAFFGVDTFLGIATGLAFGQENAVTVWGTIVRVVSEVVFAVI